MSSLATIYAYFSLREWKIIHAALKHYFTTNHRMIDGIQTSEQEIYNIRCKLPSASGGEL